MVFMDVLTNAIFTLILLSTLATFLPLLVSAWTTPRSRLSLTGPVLTHWIPDAQLIVETDASDYTLGAILSIVTSNSEVHPLAFCSHAFSSSELNYDTHDKELLASF